MQQQPQQDTGFGPNDQVPGYREPTNDDEQYLLRDLRQIPEMVKRRKPAKEFDRFSWEAYAVSNNFILERGRFYTPTPLPKKYGRGKKRCNDFETMLFSMDYPDLTYVEGRAFWRELRVPVDLSWCCNPDGSIVSPLARRPADAYFGVPFSKERIKAHFRLCDSTQSYSSFFCDRFFSPDEITPQEKPEKSRRKSAVPPAG